MNNLSRNALKELLYAIGMAVGSVFCVFLIPAIAKMGNLTMGPIATFTLRWMLGIGCGVIALVYLAIALGHLVAAATSSVSRGRRHGRAEKTVN